MAQQGFAPRRQLPWRLLVVCLSLSLPGMTDAQTLRGVGSKASLIGAEEIRAVIMQELFGALRHEPQLEVRLQQLEDEIRPFFQALPKNEYGKLGHAAASYLVHRLFLQRHGVVINGIAPMADSFNSSSVADGLEGRVPSKVQAMFEDLLKGHGLGIHELAILTSTLERLMHQEIVSDLASAYDMFNYSTPPERIDTAIATDVISFYLLNYGIEPPLTVERLRHHQTNARAGTASLRVQAMWESAVAAVAGHPNFADGFFTLGSLATVADTLVERLGGEQRSRCSDLKGALLDLESESVGEVPLRDFYQSFLDGRQFWFREPVDLLRALGALKENQDGTTGVLIANYLLSPINCNSGSSFHAVCCQNECEPILDRLDREISSPLASPDQVLRVIASMSSPTMAPTRALSSELKGRLDTIAGQRGGLIALHGRMFAEWLHAAFPRECPYPHSSGTTDPSAAHTWSQDRLVASEVEMRRIVEEQRSAHLAVEQVSRPEPVGSSWVPKQWSEQEELLAHHKQPEPQGAQAMTGFLGAVHCMVCFGAIVLVSSSLLLQPLKSALAHKEQLLPRAKGKVHQS